MFMKKIYDYLFITLFFLVITLPNLLFFFGMSSKTDNFENRNLNIFPVLPTNQLNRLPKLITSFYDDNFGMRNLLIRSNNIIRLDFAGAKNIAGTIIGRNDWYFTNNTSVKSYHPFALSYQNVYYTQDELLKIKNLIEEKNDWFSKRAIPFFIVIVPDKEAVYPEFYPYQENILTNLRLDQLIHYLNVNSNIHNIIDLRPILISAKGEIPLYFKTDHHWNNYGAFFAYQEIMKKLREVKPNVVIPQLSDFEIEPEPYHLLRGSYGLPTYYTRMPVNLGVNFYQKRDFQNKKLKSIYIWGDSFASTAFWADTNKFLEQFPKLRSNLNLFFKDPAKGILAKKPEDLIPIIKNILPDQGLQDALITYLIDSQATDQGQFGLEYFLPFSFTNVIHSDNTLPLDYANIETEKPDVFITEVDQVQFREFLLQRGIW